MNQCTDDSELRFSLEEPKKDVYSKVIYQRLPPAVREELVTAGLITKTGEVYDAEKL